MPVLFYLSPIVLSIFALLKNKGKYEVVIGLEVHAQLMTSSKIFCCDSTEFGASPNTNVSPVSLAHPGTLPVMNAKAQDHAITLGLALNCIIQQHHYFARKNYFYPDLPKGYQITQHTSPVCTGGYVTVNENGSEKNIRLNRIHMEEDAGKSVHDLDPAFTCIDLNRAGVPLLEIVTEPDIRSASEASLFLTELRKIVRWIGVCDGNMEEGSMRCDANISVRLKGDNNLGTRVEVKNLNSIRNVKRAIEIESDRLIEMTESGISIIQETRSYDADNNITFSLRSKEEADDYRYFPEPDLPPFFITEKYINEIQAMMPELPASLKTKYTTQYKLTEYDAAFLTGDKETASFFETIIKHSENYKAVANWISGPVQYYCNEECITVDKFPVKASALAELINLTESGLISFQNASGKILPELITNPGSSAKEVAAKFDLLKESASSAIEEWVDQALASMPEKVKEYRNGKKGLQGLFAGEVKKLSKGKADMQIVNKLLIEKLNK